MHVTLIIQRGSVVGVVGRPVQPQHDSGVLYASVGVEQLGTHDAHLGAQRVVQHGVEPIVPQDCRIVIERSRYSPRACRAARLFMAE